MAPKKPAEREYNFIFEKMVGGPDDIVGLIAYGLYKRKKIEFIHDFRAKNDRGPSEPELHSFHEISCGHIEEYRQSAEHNMQASFLETNGMVIDRMQEEADAEVKTRLKGSFLGNVFASIVGTFLTALLVGAIIVALVGYKQGWSTAGRLILNEVDTVGETVTHPSNGSANK
jgi:hypothetical protein